MINYKVYSVDIENLEKEAEFIVFDKAWDYFASEVANGRNHIVLLYQKNEDAWDLIDEYRDEFSYPENLEKEEGES
jgi:hypothetical protein